MKKFFIFILFLSNLNCVSLSLSKSFVVKEVANEKTWNKANIWVYKNKDYNFFTSNKYIIQTHNLVVLREPVGNEYIYQIVIGDIFYSTENGLLTTIIERERKREEFLKILKNKVDDFETFVIKE